MLESYIPTTVRDYLEEHYYSEINRQARLEAVFQNLAGHRQNYIAWFADHGVVHARDIAQQVLNVLDLINGVLIDARPPQRLERFMKGYGVLLAYFHDIGLVDFTHFGRSMHPEFASQAIFTPDFDFLIDEIWAKSYGSVTWWLVGLDRDGILQQPPELVLREMIALCVAHSKSKVSSDLLDDPVALRHWMLSILETDLEVCYRCQKEGALPAFGGAMPPDPARRELLGRYYPDFHAQAYLWLVSGQPALRELVQDCMDTLRALRCADALRQRGTTLKTSGGYEVFASRQTGNGVLALRREPDALYFVEVDDPLTAGEANLASSELTPDGDLRLTFHVGNFSTPAALGRAAHAAARVANDLQNDVVGSFPAPAPHQPGKKAIRILLENAEDNPNFVDCVIDELRKLNPQAAARVAKVASLQSASDFERTRYLLAPELKWEPARYAAVLEQVYQTGQKSLDVDPRQAFHQVRKITLQPGETLVEAGAPAGFVYIPMGNSLKVYPLGGYQAFPVEPWMPLGATGVIRGAVRNARVVAEMTVDLLVIPKEVFLEHWYKPYTMEELSRMLMAPPEPRSS